MAKRPYVDFKELKAKIRLTDVLKVLGLEDKFKKNGDGLVGVCPIPSHIHGPIPNDEQFKTGRKDGVDVWHCFGDCQRGGDVIEFAKEMTGYDNAHIRLWFAEKFPDKVSVAKPKNGKAETAPQPPPEPTPEATAAAPPAEAKAEPLKPLRFFLKLDGSAEYLKKRNVETTTVERYGLGLCSRGFLNGYLAIPIRDFPADNLVAYMGRWPGEDYNETTGKSRYRLPPDFPAHRVVYGLKQALEGTEGKPLIVVEGPFKVFHLYQHGFTNVVSCLTASVSEEQAAILASTRRPIILFFDGNEAGYKGARTAAGRLITKTFVRAIKLPEGREPDDLSREELVQLLAL